MLFALSLVCIVYSFHFSYYSAFTPVFVCINRVVALHFTHSENIKKKKNKLPLVTLILINNQLKTNI